MPHLLRLCSLLALFLLAPTLRAALVSYDFGTTGSPTANATAVDAHLTASAFSALSGGGLLTTDGNPGASFRGNRDWNKSPGDLTGNYFTFTLTAGLGYQINLASISASVKASASGPVSYQWYSSVDNFASAIGGGTVTTSWTTPAAVDLSGAAYQGLSAVTFRLYGHDAPNNGVNSDFFVDNITVDGITAVPEPTTVALGVFAVLFGAITALRRRAAGR